MTSKSDSECTTIIALDTAVAQRNFLKVYLSKLDKITEPFENLNISMIVSATMRVIDALTGTSTSSFSTEFKKQLARSAETLYKNFLSAFQIGSISEDVVQMMKLRNTVNMTSMSPELRFARIKSAIECTIRQGKMAQEQAELGEKLSQARVKELDDSTICISEDLAVQMVKLRNTFNMMSMRAELRFASQVRNRMHNQARKIGSRASRYFGKQYYRKQSGVRPRRHFQ
eukprot:TRINITY_DN674_c0_g1_i1.p1 TRINITY_DN674_c0_g1~~TRINITY_DN674_c0_g1_i1.p1  ORF type:complete len:229 (+),score=22.48 TRINITY_DN674_c0_g1_i1:136-822(+)